MKKPDFFIVGAAKCGTTAMYHFLAQHPEIFMPREKEPHFLESDMRLPSDTRTMEWYLSLFRNAGDEKRLGEASPSYIYSKTAAREIKQLNACSRIVVMIRNPVEMLYSVYYQRLAAGYENIRDFSEAIYTGSAEAARFRTKVERRLGLRLPVYLEVPKFADQISRYMEVFGRDKVLVIVYDDFRRDNEGVYREVLKFLEVDESFRPEFRVINGNKRFRSRTLRRLFQKAPGLLADSARKVRILKDIKHGIDNFNRESFERPLMDPLLKEKLRKEYAPDIDRLSEMLGRDLTCWTKDRDCH